MISGRAMLFVICLFGSITLACLNVHSCGVSFRFVLSFALRDCISGTLFNGEHMNKFIINKEVFEIIVAMLETFTFVNDGICERLSMCESKKLVR